MSLTRVKRLTAARKLIRHSEPCPFTEFQEFDMVNPHADIRGRVMPHFIKVSAIREALCLHPEVDFLFIADLDFWIVNFTRTIQSLLPPEQLSERQSDGVHFLAPRDDPALERFSNYAMLFRNSVGGRRLLRMWFQAAYECTAHQSPRGL
eukprot:gene34158-biopygen16843